LHLLSAVGSVQSRIDPALGVLPGLEPPPALAIRQLVEVAHDIRSPLAAVLFVLDMLRSGRSGPVNAAQQQQLRLAQCAVLGLNQIACDLIDYVRGPERFDQGERCTFSVSAVVQSVVDILQPMAEEKGVALEILTPEIDARLGLASLISRVLLNLSANAVQYSDGGVVLLKVRETGRTKLEFAVVDNGRSIPHSVVPHLFDAFRPTADDSRRIFSSSGLGLAVCHRLIGHLGGTLRLTSDANSGTRFEFELDLPPA
jgi:signal transduction histidine kinase